MPVESTKRLVNFGGMPVKHLTLIALTIQSSILILVMHYSRVMTPVKGHRYLPSTALFLGEVVKLAISLTMALYEIATHPRTLDTSTAAGLFGELARAVFSADGWKVGVTAMLYALQNSLQFIANDNLDAATFQAANQLKILTTALFSVFLLGRVLNSRKWLSLVFLMLGVAMVHIPAGGAQSPVMSIKDLRLGTQFHEIHNIWDWKAIGTVAAGQLSKRSATYEGIDEDFGESHPEIRPSIGLTTLALACLTSGFASIYFEKILKEPKGDLTASPWIRNVQLSFYSIWPALLFGVIFQDGHRIAQSGFFTGYNWVVWMAILLQAAGGVLIAFVIKYADNITKNFAMSISIILSFLASVLLFDFEITSFYLLGTGVVLSATYLYYNTPDSGKLKAPQIRVAESEKKHEASYFDLESIPTPARSPLHANEALSTSRPGTPTYERLPHKMKIPDLRMAKRDQ